MNLARNAALLFVDVTIKSGRAISVYSYHLSTVREILSTFSRLINN